ncbi:hypothetical protein C8Q77DRAFT_763383 [Trametes polyzona]|nr:hypothetical protein C8Q77DRAFT_763383 [Trametes polyzona]
MEPLTRAEKLRVLSSMGVGLPENTKLADEALDKRLRAALDAAQERHRFPATLNVRELPQWPIINKDEINSRARPLLDAVKRGNMEEAARISQARLTGVRATPELFTDPFMDLRQTLMSLANARDNGFTWLTIQDPDSEHYAINIRFLETYEIVGRNTPPSVARSPPRRLGIRLRAVVVSSWNARPTTIELSRRLLCTVVVEQYK